MKYEAGNRPIDIVLHCKGNHPDGDVRAAANCSAKFPQIRKPNLRSLSAKPREIQRGDKREGDEKKRESKQTCQHGNPYLMQSLPKSMVRLG